MADRFNRASKMFTDGDDWWITRADGLSYKLAREDVPAPDTRTYEWADKTPFRVGQFVVDMQKTIWIVVDARPPRLHCYAERAQTGEMIYAVGDPSRYWTAFIQEVEDNAGPVSRLDQPFPYGFG